MTTTKRRISPLQIVEISLGIALAVSLLWGAGSLYRQQELAGRVVRLHILANSDSEEDQALKLHVRDRVLARAEELLADAHDRERAEQVLTEALPELTALAEREIADQGYDYPVTARLEQMAFPTREYDGFALPAGEYLALRIIIGAGRGHNWWCVVFPPLCTETTTDLAQTAMAAGLTEEDVALITEEEGYVLKFKSIELWEALKARIS